MLCCKDNIIFNHFESRDYTVTNAQEPTDFSFLQNLSFTIVQNLPQINKLLKAIRQCIPYPDSNGTRRFFYLLEEPEEEKNIIRKTVQDFTRYGLLLSSNIEEDTISGIVNPMPRATRFITGQWLEIYAACITQDIVNSFATEHQLPYSVLTNVELKKNGKLAHEIDCCFSVGSSVFATEQKGGNFNNYLHLHEIGKSLGIIPDHYLLLQTSLTDLEQMDLLQYFYQFYVCNLSTFSDKLRAMLKQVETDSNSTVQNALLYSA